MNKELYVSSTPHETKVALMEDDQLAEVFFERENEYTLAGSIYKGRVTRVLPGMQSAFVDIGLERDAFLYVSDFLEVGGDEEDEEEFGSIPAAAWRHRCKQSRSRAGEHSSKPSPPLLSLKSRKNPKLAAEDFAAAEEQSARRRHAKLRRRRIGIRRKVRAAGVDAVAVVADVAARRDERDDRPEPKTEAAKPCAGDEEAPSLSSRETRPAPRPRTDYGPPAGYTPIVLPGESISKYRNLPQQPAPESEATKTPRAGFLALRSKTSFRRSMRTRTSALAIRKPSRVDLESRICRRPNPSSVEHAASAILPRRPLVVAP